MAASFPLPEPIFNLVKANPTVAYAYGKAEGGKLTYTQFLELALLDLDGEQRRLASLITQPNTVKKK